MAGIEGFGHDPGAKPFRTKEAGGDRNFVNGVDLNAYLNQQRQNGHGEVVPIDGSDQPGGASTAAAGLEGAHGAAMDSVGGNVAVLERPMVQAQPEGPIPGLPPPEAGIRMPNPHNAEAIRIALTSFDQNADTFAREAAHEKMSKKFEGRFWKRIAQSAWHNMSREYQLVKATREARQDILENNNLRHHQGNDVNDTAWREATVERYGSEYGEALIHDGETFHKLSSPETARDPKAERINNDIKDVMRQVARGGVGDNDDLQMIIDRMTEAWRTENISQDYIGEGQLLATNIGNKARELEALINSAEGLDDIDREALLEAHLSKLEIVAGEARVGSRTEIDSTISERIAEKMRNVPFISEGTLSRVVAVLGNETFVAAMMSGVMYGAGRGASIAGRLIMPGIGAGIVAGIRERNALLHERALEERRADAGMAPAEAPDASTLSRKRRFLNKIGIGKTEEQYRAELNATQYESKPVTELLADLGRLYDDETGELNLRNRADFDNAMQLLGQVRARIQIGDRTGARLINFADISPEQMEQQRFGLDLAMAKLETDMGKLFGNPVAEIMLGLNPDENFANLADQQREIANGALMGEMNAQDRLFNKLVFRRVLKRTLATTLMGMAGGEVIHYGVEGAREAFGYARELFGQMFKSVEMGSAMNLAAFETGSPSPDHVGGVGTPDHLGTPSPTPTHVGTETSGGSTPNHVGTQTGNGNGAPSHVGTQQGADNGGTPNHVGTQTETGTPNHVGTPEGSPGGESAQISETSKLNLPQGYNAEVNHGNGTLTITGPDGKEYTDLRLNPDGSLSGSAEATLRADGFNIIDNQDVVTGTPEVTHENVSTDTFYKNHEHDMKLIHHKLWFDENTPAPKFDLNELGLQNSVDEHGNVIISIQGMTAGGSFHGASSVDWHEAAKEGHMKIFLSAGKGHQAHAFEVRISPDGKVMITNDMPERALFTADGVFKGTGFEEASLDLGQASDGGENIATLATVVGNGDTTVTDTIHTPTFETTHTYTITPPASGNPAGSTAFTGQPAAFTGPANGSNNVFPFVPVTTRRRVGQPERAATSPGNREVIASVTPIRPDVATSPARDQAAEANAQARGLSAAASGIGPAAGGREQQQGQDNSATSGIGPEAGTPTQEGADGGEQGNEHEAAFPANEAPFIASIDAENRSFPLMEAGIDLAELTVRQRKLLTMLAYEAMDRFPRGAAESDFGYDRRIKRELRSAAVKGMEALVARNASANMRALAGAVFNAARVLRTPAPTRARPAA